MPVKFKQVDMEKALDARRARKDMLREVRAHLG
jgi:hypothetical protein